MDEDKFMLEHVSPLEFLSEVFNCNELPLAVRMRAATAAAPFVHPKLAAVAHYDGGSIGEKLNRGRRMYIAKQVVTGQKKLLDLRPDDRPTADELAEARNRKPLDDGSAMGKRLAKAEARVVDMRSRIIDESPGVVVDVAVKNSLPRRI